MLSKTAEYALRVIACLAFDPEVPQSADVLSEKTQVPRRYLQKVLKDLAKAHLVHSRSGPGGGYAILKSARTITILDVINAVAPLERIRHCPLGLKSHTRLCPLHRELDKAYAATEQAFSNVTIAQVLRSTGDVVPLCDVART